MPEIIREDSGPWGIIGTGVDIIDNRRMEQALARWGRKFKDRVFLKSEQVYCEQKACSTPHYASRFAVKEAVAKAFGTGIGASLGWLDMEVVRLNGGGAPGVELISKGAQLAEQMNVGKIFISISHTHHYSAATAVIAVQIKG